MQALCFSQDGYLLVSSADDEMVKVWNVSDGECLKTLEGKTDVSSHCGFHPSGTLVASGSAMTTVALATGNPGETVTSNGGAPHILAGEEILDKEVAPRAKLRPQSAHPLGSLEVERSVDSSNTSRRNRPRTAVAGSTKAKDDIRNISLDNVERWLSSSYQRL